MPDRADSDSRSLKKPSFWFRFNRRVIEKALALGDKPASKYVLFVIAVLQSALIPLPLLAVFLTLSIGAPRRVFQFALVTAAGSVVGGSIAYSIGYTAWETVKGLFIPHLFSERLLAKVEVIYRGNIVLALLVVSLSPISYQVASVAAGVLKVNYWAFLAASCIARPARFLLIALFVRLFGNRARHFIENHLPWVGWALLAIIFVVGLVAVAIRIFT